MIVFPAIDLKGGQVVRLAEGDMARATVYGDDPAAQATLFAEAGSQYLHVVDLDGSFAGKAENREAVAASPANRARLEAFIVIVSDFWGMPTRCIIGTSPHSPGSRLQLQRCKKCCSCNRSMARGELVDVRSRTTLNSRELGP